MPGVVCEPRHIPVRLGPGAVRVWTVVGELCRPVGDGDRTLQVLVSGAGYGVAYWDFPHEPDTYSYARSTLRAGDAVFNFDRLGMGRSDHPPGLSLDVDTQAYVLHQVLGALAGEPGVTGVVTLGHSFGSTVALAHALAWPGQVDGIVLTGFFHQVNRAFGPRIGRDIRIAAFSGPVAGDLLDPTYVISRPGSRGDVFYVRDNTDPAVLDADDATRETTAAGELLSMSRYFGDQSRLLTRPVLVLIGERDFVLCGDGVDCTDHAAVAAHESRFYPAEACPEVRVLDDTGHNVNLHRNAPSSFVLMQDWIRRRVGSAGLPATEPCTIP
jgi:pimeloyl-ACP methyl ester carboxylesterase